MKILISNDDGVYAPGIKSLHSGLVKDHDVFTVAPLEERSTTGHTLSLDNPLRVVTVDKEKNIYGCSGFPADCTLMGFGKLMDSKPDLIISGINRGANLGQDIYYSGTVAAAREGVFHGIPGIAISSVCDFKNHDINAVNFDTASLFLKKIVKTKDFLNLISPFHLININVPDIPPESVKGLKITNLGFRRYSEEISEREDFRGRSYYWVGGIYKGFEGDDKTDCFAVEDGFISLTVLNLLGGKAEKLDKWHDLANNFVL
ncbi:MAG: 5'/3'-nucleotidase SurE [Bacteriovoracaceae bacterium]|nr:5'/3'-nucleotidase SurE [Bacteriovoracaceae bacterium]